jgi:outer membrane receptor for ferric coprogen and ferric-rhodotorulic acid
MIERVRKSFNRPASHFQPASRSRKNKRLETEMGLVKSRAAALMGGIALAIVAQQGAQAQNINASNITLLERLVIGAGAPKVAINTPQAVTVLNQADLDKEQAATTGELFATVPGVAVVAALAPPKTPRMARASSSMSMARQSSTSSTAWARFSPTPNFTSRSKCCAARPPRHSTAPAPSAG